MVLAIIKLLFYCIIGAIFIYAAASAIFLYSKLERVKKEDPFISLLAWDIRRKTGM